MTRTHLMTALLGLSIVWCTMPAAKSDQLRIALVIYNEEYAGLPDLKRCAASATVARDALHSKGSKSSSAAN